MVISAWLSPETAHAQEYPWCVSRESYLYCFYKTQEQCRWAASGIGGCALNPRLLFPNKPRDSNARATSRSKTCRAARIFATLGAEQSLCAQVTLAYRVAR